jgi:hypothetical protein
MKFFHSMVGVSLAIILAGSWGCSKAKTEKNADQARAEQVLADEARVQAEQARAEKARIDFQTIMMACDQLQQEGKLAEAMAALEGALANRELSLFKGDVFQRILFAELTADNLSGAQTRYLTMRRADMAVAQRYQGLIEGHLFERQQFAALGEWVTSLLKEETDEGLILALARWQFRAARAQGTANAAVITLTPLGTRVSPVAWRGLAGEFGSILIQSGVADEAGQLIEFLGAREAADPEIGPLRITLRLALWISRQEWDPATEFLKGLATKTGDAPFNGYFVQIADPLRRAQQNEKLVALCKWAIYELKDKPATRETAAQMYVRNAVEIEQVALALDRINELKTAGFDVTHVARWLDLAYPISMKNGVDEDFKALLVLCEAILPGLADPRDQANVAGIILDVSFRLDRFETALKVVERGVNGQDKAWHEAMINKVKAHIDMQQGRPLDAAQKFTKYLNETASTMEPAIDPITGELITRAMVQGLNAKRIADLMKKGGNDAEAAVYYAKTREYYSQALKTIDPKSSWVQKIKTELAEIPQ